MSEEKLDQICFYRGIDINQTVAERKEDLKLWLAISNERNVPHSLLFTTRVLDFHSGMFSIGENETEDEILRRSKEDVYYIETVRVFE